MTARTKRTYNLSPQTVSQVRELAGQSGSATSQDAVVELAVDRLYREFRDRQDEELWARAADDPGFRGEMRSIATAYADTEEWPA
jgi:hypothetical protein